MVCCFMGARKHVTVPSASARNERAEFRHHDNMDSSWWAMNTIGWNSDLSLFGLAIGLFTVASLTQLAGSRRAVIRYDEL